MPPNGQTKFRSAYHSRVGIESGRLGLEDGPGIRLPLTQESTYWQAPQSGWVGKKYLQNQR